MTNVAQLEQKHREMLKNLFASKDDKGKEIEDCLAKLKVANFSEFDNNGFVQEELGYSVEDWNDVVARAHLSPLHTPVPLAHHTSTKKNNNFHKNIFKKIISRINFIQKFPTNYSTKLSRFFLCLLDTMCLVHPHFLTVHLQTSHSISI